MKQVIGISLGDTAAGLRAAHRTARPEAAGAPTRHRRQTWPKLRRLLRHWDSRADAIGLGLAKDSGGPRRRRAPTRGAPAGCAPGQPGALQQRRAAGRHPARMGGAPCAGHARPLLRQRPGAVLLGPGAPEAGAVDGRVHAQPALRRPGAAARLAQAADLAGRAGPVCQRHALRVRLGAAAAGQRSAARAMGAVRAAPRRAPCHGAGGAGAPARRPGPGGAGRQDHHHPHRQRGAAGGLQGQGRAPGHRRQRRWCRATRSTLRCSTPCCWPPPAGTAATCSTTTTWRSSAPKACSRGCCTRTASSASTASPSSSTRCRRSTSRRSSRWRCCRACRRRC